MNTQIIRWNPLKEMEQLQNRLTAIWNRKPIRTNGGGEESLTVSEWTPAVDIVEDEREFLIKVELPEIKREDVRITVENGILTLTGERKADHENKTRKFHRIEREFGSFTRSFSLPVGTSGEKVTADFKDGLLKVHLPKDAKATPKAIEIKAT